MRWAIHNDGGVRKTASVCPGGVNPNDKTVMINPPGRTWRGVNENLSPALQSTSVMTRSVCTQRTKLWF